MNILLTGATGFLGKHIIEEFSSNKEINLIMIGRRETGLYGIDYNINNFRNIDLRNNIDLEDIFKKEKIDYVIHSAAKSNDWGDYKSFYDNNYIVTKNIIKCVKKYKIKRLIHISTPSIYFDFKNKKNITEDHKNNNLVNNYAKTKKKAEELLEKESKNGLNFIGLRPRGIYGEYDQSIFPKIIKIANKDKFPLMNKGQSEIDITYVKNVVHAISLSIKADKKCEGNFYNITDGKPKKVKDILDHVFKKLGKNIEYKKVNYKVIKVIALMLEALSFITKKEPLMTRYSISLLSFDQTLSIEKARKELKYEPIYSFEEGISNFVRWKNG